MINIIFYYVFYCSAVLFYCIGLNRVTILVRLNNKNLFPLLLKCSISIISTTVISHLIAMQLFVQTGFVELTPLLALLVFVSVSVIVEILMRITTGINTPEFAVSYLIVLLSLTESTDVFESIIISASCIVSFVIVLSVLYALRYRIDITRSSNDRVNKQLLIMIAVSLVIISLAAWNVSWITKLEVR